MFKSSFAKYLTAFVIIILASFLMLSAIITSIIRTHTMQDKESKLELSSSLIANHFEEQNIKNLEGYLALDLGASSVTLFPLLNIDYEFNLFITAPEGKVLLSTFPSKGDAPVVGGDLGSVDLSGFENKTGDDGAEYLYYHGRLEGPVNGNAIVYGSSVEVDGELCGYVFTVASTENEDRLIGITRQAVINGSIWVMLAALVAAYIITERIVHPLKSMTVAVKKFAKGDFSERIAVSGSDEMAELGLAFNNMADSLDNLEKMRYSFLASVSHDLRTPMTTISGFIDGINSGAIPPEKQGHYLQIISSEVHRLSRLVSQILDVSRLDSGDRKFSPTDFDITEVGRLIIISLEHKLEDKKLDVSFDADEDSLFAFADRDAIHQVIYNLLHNAIKFSKDGGRLAVSFKRIQGKKLLVSVYDEGQRMSDEDAARIFDKFYKSDKSRGLDKDGVGLGLYICKSIVDAHGESIGVNILEDGCEFWFTVKEGTRTQKSKSVELL